MNVIFKKYVVFLFLSNQGKTKILKISHTLPLSTLPLNSRIYAGLPTTLSNSLTPSLRFAPSLHFVTLSVVNSSLHFVTFALNTRATLGNWATGPRLRVFSVTRYPFMWFNVNHVKGVICVCSYRYMSIFKTTGNMGFSGFRVEGRNGTVEILGGWEI